MRGRANTNLVSEGGAPGPLIERVRRGLAEEGTDCGCRETANELLDRIRADEDFVRCASGLADARRMRDAIVALIALLRELDAVRPDEPDRSTFHEISGLFRDMSEFASFGADAARRRRRRNS
jgi:hypothetical protein